VPGVGHLQLGQLLDVGVDQLGEAAQQPAAVAGGHRAPGRERGRGALDGGVGLLERGEADGGDDLLGGRVDDLVDGTAHNRSNPRTLSQSVTAAWKAVSSTRAAFV
jgi:hypothetical protein